ncbi:23S rRNA (adenine(2503)-C(2))-methyltransferase RlmN [Gynuella sunshinyii]|uniref:Dual-specificity RNA methyltransferase RlmN n=1 Tax=Gynuella sunshinyii YC6258 TaxID=1445510 RepID=A0A0C5VMB2_9GAMM|nr:23S rRNA (adenine(2503)-C(2))-methyltransferase RlmN [Gynuella sunshinyii]AJQ94488.1 putative Fe-S-cluster redox enzyme [Gynuella sunshinyii YC6258]
MSLSGDERVNLMGMTISQLEDFFVQMGEKKYRAVQVVKWIHQRGVSSIEEMTDISRSLREKLAGIAVINAPEVTYQKDSKDGTRKWIMKMPGGSSVETVFIPEEGRGTLCVSSQIGCSLDCSFCSTGKQGFNRDLTAAEIIGQVWLAVKSFDQPGQKRERRVTNVVMMGMGEPLLNFDNVIAAMNLMMEDNAYGLSKRRVTLSTSGVVPAIEQMHGVTDACLALSLHAPNDELRNQLVPINRKYGIEKTLQACRAYLDQLGDKRVATIEYTLIDGINDEFQHAQELAQVLRQIPCKINLIPFNPFPNSGYRRPSNNRIHRFRETLQQAGYNVTVRKTRGDDIDAACGQLVGRVQDLTKRNQRFIDAVQLGVSAAERAHTR